MYIHIMYINFLTADNTFGPTLVNIEIYFSYSSFGTTLCLNTVEHTLDGRSLITTTGEKRFEVLSKSSCDGYNVANIRFIVDHPVTDHQEIGEISMYIQWNLR